MADYPEAGSNHTTKEMMAEGDRKLSEALTTFNQAKDLQSGSDYGQLTPNERVQQGFVAMHGDEFRRELMNPNPTYRQTAPEESAPARRSAPRARDTNRGYRQHGVE